MQFNQSLIIGCLKLQDEDGSNSGWDRNRAESACTKQWKPPLLPQQQCIRLWTAGLWSTNEQSGHRPLPSSTAALLYPARLLCPCTTSTTFPPLPVADALLI